MTVLLKYFNLYESSQDICLFWETEFNWDLSVRGIIKFYTRNSFDQYHIINNVSYIYNGFINGASSLHLVGIILHIIEAAIVGRKILENYKVYTTIKKRLKNDEPCHYHHDDYSSSHEHFLTGKDRWEMLKLSEKKKFFSLWYILFIFTNILGIVTGICYILSPFLTSRNQTLLGLTCFLALMCVGHFLEYEEKYSLFYLTIKKGFTIYVKYFVIYLILFTGIGILSKISSITFRYVNFFLLGDLLL